MLTVARLYQPARDMPAPASGDVVTTGPGAGVPIFVDAAATCPPTLRRHGSTPPGGASFQGSADRVKVVRDAFAALDALGGELVHQRVAAGVAEVFEPLLSPAPGIPIRRGGAIATRALTLRHRAEQ